MSQAVFEFKQKVATKRLKAVDREQSRDLPVNIRTKDATEIKSKRFPDFLRSGNWESAMV